MRRASARFGAVAITIALAVMAVIALSSQPADAGAAQFHVAYTGGEGISERLSPTAAPGAGWGAPEGALLDVQCQVIGEPVGPGNDLYFRVVYDGRTFYAPDTFTDSPHLAGQPPIAGIPMCGASPAAPGPLTVGCFGDYCSGQSPQQTGCSRDAVTTRSQDLIGARLELRWSPTCKTNWARYIQYERGWYLGNVPLELRAVQDTGYTQRLSYGVNGTPTGTTFSPMIYSPVRLVRAELVVQCQGAGDCAQGALTGENPIKTEWG
jgi:hypothetical protein